MQPKNVTNSRDVQVVSGLEGSDVDTIGQVGIDGTKYPNYLIFSLSKLSILNEGKTKLKQGKVRLCGDF